MAAGQKINGPRDTTISAVADRAGVQRLTVYRHFPDEESLFRACSSHWLERNPPPDIAGWQRVEDPGRRSAAALTALYRYYEDTQSMWSLVYRDRTQVPAMQAPLEAFHAYLDRIGDDICTSWQPRGRKPRKLKATVRHVLRFGCWASLDAMDVDDAEKVELAVRWIESVAT